MSKLGQNAKYPTEQMFSALPPTTDIRRRQRSDRFVSKSDIDLIHDLTR
jgi:hypothetical protein